MQTRYAPHPTSPFVRSLAILALALAAAGCATERTLEITTSPSGADIWVDGVKQPGGTPARLSFAHYRYFTVRIEKPGYAPIATEIDIESQIDGYPLIDLPFELLNREKRFQRHFQLDPLPRRPGLADAERTLSDARRFSDQARRTAREGPPAGPDVPAPRFPPRRPPPPPDVLGQ